MEYLLSLAGFLILVLTSVLGPKSDRPAGWRRWAIIVVGLGMAGLSFLQAQDRNRLNARLLAEPFRVREAHLRIRMEAFLDEFDASDSTILQNCPKAIIVDENATIGPFHFRCDLVRTDAVHRVNRWRGSSTTSIVYNSSNLSLESVLYETDWRGYEYWWDLDGKELRFRIPTHEFRLAGERGEWWFRVELYVGSRLFWDDAEKDGFAEVLIANFNQRQVMKADW